MSTLNIYVDYHNVNTDRQQIYQWLTVYLLILNWKEFFHRRVYDRKNQIIEVYRWVFVYNRIIFSLILSFSQEFIYFSMNQFFHWKRIGWFLIQLYCITILTKVNNYAVNVCNSFVKIKYGFFMTFIIKLYTRLFHVFILADKYIAVIWVLWKRRNLLKREVL